MCDTLVSIIIPVYNSEKFLNRCLKSIINQTYKHLEILLIDDGSFDNSPKICDDWALKDSRICVIHKDNEGPGIAREYGIKEAKGKYICFFDSDDFIEPEAVFEAVNLAEKNDSDVVVFGFNTVNKEGNITESFVPKSQPLTFEGIQVTKKFLPDMVASCPKGNGERFYYMSLWVMLYSSKIFSSSDSIFPKDSGFLCGEDIYAILNLFSRVNKISILPKALYNYCENTDSISRSYNINRFDAVKNFFVQTTKLCEKLNYDNDVLYRLTEPYLSFIIASLKQMVKSDIDKKEKKKILFNVINDELLQSVLDNVKKDSGKMTRKIFNFLLRKKMYYVSYIVLRMQ